MNQIHFKFYFGIANRTYCCHYHFRVAAWPLSTYYTERHNIEYQNCTYKLVTSTHVPSGKRHLFSVFRLFGLKNQSWWYCTRNDTDGIWTVDLWCQKQLFYQMFKFPPQKSIPISPVRRLNTNNICGRPIIIMHKLTYSYKC